MMKRLYSLVSFLRPSIRRSVTLPRVLSFLEMGSSCRWLALVLEDYRVRGIDEHAQMERGCLSFFICTSPSAIIIALRVDAACKQHKKNTRALFIMAAAVKTCSRLNGFDEMPPLQ